MADWEFQTLRNIPMRFVLLAIAAYAMDIVFTTYVETSLEAWYIAHLSWHWIFWNSVVMTPIMLLLVMDEREGNWVEGAPGQACDHKHGE